MPVANRASKSQSCGCLSIALHSHTLSPSKSPHIREFSEKQRMNVNHESEICVMKCSRKRRQRSCKCCFYQSTTKRTPARPTTYVLASVFCVYLAQYCCSSFQLVLPTSTATSVRRRTSNTRSSITIPLTLSTTSSSSALEQLTVKELRQLVKDGKNVERGLLSRLKRKQDLIDYLVQQQQSQEDSVQHEEQSHDAANGDVAEAPPIEKPSTSKKPKSSSVRIRSMPSIHQQQNVDDNDTTATSASSSQSPSPKDVIFEYVYDRYPPLRNETFIPPGDGELDIRHEYHPMLQNSKASDLDLVFVGTASCTPGVTRGVSCTAIRLNWRRRWFDSTLGKTNNAPPANGFTGGTWIFDVGEATQLQVQRTSSIKPGKITKIFLTHAHGDHTFGLPGLLCLMGQDRDRDAPPVEIYGPEGLRMWLRVAIRYSVARIVPHYRVHELMDVPMAPEWERNRRTSKFFRRLRKQPGESWGTKGLAGEDPQSWITKATQLTSNLPPTQQYGEIEGGKDIFPIYDHPLSHDGAPIWEVEDEEDVKVYAAPMSHGVPCVGYVVDEASRPGRLRNEIVEPIVRRNVQALKSQGFKVPMKAMAVIKNLPVGSSFTFPDGTVVSQSEAVEPPRDGRKIVICGDTADCRAIEGLAQGADVLVHEATNTYLAGVDTKETTIKMVTKDAMTHGHSTPYMAGDFARRIGAKRLVLNHFSGRYKGDQSVDSLSLMTRIEMQAIKASGLDETNVAASWDLMILPVPQN